ncbi:MAG: PHP domain-containing protein, partial [Chloroflexi bacterium]|nr:PHP domain-containing protein [Chloroflexota bacterium]
AMAAGFRLLLIGARRSSLPLTRMPVEVIPGIELSSDVARDEVHMLGYFIDCQNEDLLDVLQRLRAARVDRARRMVQKLAELGMPLNWQRIEEIAQGESIGRPHIAQAMLEQGYIKNTTEAFELFIGRNGPAYAERYKLSPVDCINLVRQAGGLAVLAHPYPSSQIFAELETLQANGLVGIEAYYGDFDQEQIDFLVETASRLGLIATGGSDFHGLNPETETPPGGVFVPQSAVDQLKSARDRAEGFTGPKTG